MEALKVPRPILYPGRDIHGGQTGPSVDMCVEIRGHGRVYLSENAVKLAARALGYPSTERHERLQELAAKQRARIAELEAELAELDGLRSLGEAVKAFREPAPEPEPAVAAGPIIFEREVGTVIPDPED